MKVFKPLQASLFYKNFNFKSRHQLSISVMFGFPFEPGNEPINEPDLWKFIANEIGDKEILDIGIPKPNGEVIVIGKYYAPNKIPVRTDIVRLTCGEIDKTLVVFGDRYWRALLGPSEPENITTMALDYSRSFGGEGFAKNPTGKGYVEINIHGEMRRPLPNIEYVDTVITSPSQLPDPAGFAPLDMGWQFRASKLGTYDEEWLKNRWPAYADDINWNHFNIAPQDQWFKNYPIGNEGFTLYNMHPDKPKLIGNLPNIRTRCFINKAKSLSEDITEVQMQADTIWLFPHAETGIILYRGSIEVQTSDTSDIANIIVGYESLLDKPREMAHYSQALSNRLDGSSSEKYMLNTTDLIPIGARCGFGAIMPDVLEDEISAHENAVVIKDSAAENHPFHYPRPPGHRNYPDLQKRAEELKKNIFSMGDDPAKHTDLDVEKSRITIDDNNVEIKDSYRVQAHLIEDAVPAHEENLNEIRDVLLERLRKNENVAGWDLAGLDLSNRSFVGVDFSGCYLEAVDFRNSDFSHSNLEGAILSHANLTNCNLTGAILIGTNLGSANLTRVCMDGAKMSSAILSKSILDNAKITNCDLSDVEIFETQFGNCDFSGSTIAHAEFYNLYMAGANFSNTNLNGSTFINCNLEKCCFYGASLDSVTWIDSWLDNTNFSNAKMNNCCFTGNTSLRSAKFNNGVLDSSTFREVDIRYADFSNSSINMCDFGSANAEKATFIQAKARMTQFIGTNLTAADLSSIDLYEGTLMKARLVNAKICNANCYGVEFMNAIVGETDFSETNLTRTKLEHWRPH